MGLVYEVVVLQTDCYAMVENDGVPHGERLGYEMTVPWFGLIGYLGGVVEVMEYLIVI